MGLHVHPWNAKWLISVDASRPFNRIPEISLPNNRTNASFQLETGRRTTKRVFPMKMMAEEKFFP